MTVRPSCLRGLPLRLHPESDGRHLHYKHGRLAEKRQGCLDLFKAMNVQNPTISRGARRRDRGGRFHRLEGRADKIDSMLCSISLYRHAIYRGQTTQMVGDEDNGFILLCR